MARRDPRTGEPDFWGMARSFLHVHCPRVRGLSPRTVEAYRLSLECLLDYLGEERGLSGAAVTFDAITRDAVRGWVSWMAGKRGHKPRTIGLRLTALRSFLAWCAAEDATLEAVRREAAGVRGPRAQKGPIEYLEDDGLAAVLAANTGATAKSRRNRAMLVMLYESAARVSELTAMRLGDLTLRSPARVAVVGKGGKARVVPIGEACAAHMGVYLDEFHAGGADPARPLFYSLHGGVPCPLSADAVSRVLRQAGDAARATCPGVPERVRCHMMRKTRAMSLYRAGVPLPLIMQMLGHESMATTSTFYAFATQDMMARAVADAAPAVLSEDAGWLTEERMEALYSLR